MKHCSDCMSNSGKRKTPRGLMARRFAPRRAITLFVVWISLFACPIVVQASDNDRFVRIQENDQGRAITLQVAQLSYQKPGDDRDPIRVDLISAVHMADQSYYQTLNTVFQDYDVVLYELVAPAGTRPTLEEGRRRGLLSATQVAMARFLNLSFQLEQVDYDATNFVHADLSPTELSASMKERGESLYVYFWRALYASMADYAKDPLGLRGVDMLTSAVGADGEMSMKIAFAGELTRMDQMRAVFGEDSANALIGARNERVIEVLHEELIRGARSVGIFYGAAHMPDLEQRLESDFELKYHATSWLDAWDLRPDSMRDED